MRNVSPACMGVLRDVLGCPGVTSVLTGHRVCGMLRRGIGRQPWNDVFGRRTRKPLPPLPASPRGPVTSRVVRFSRPVTHLRLTAVWVGTLGRGRPRRSIPEMRHGLSVDAPRHGAVMALTRIGLSLFTLHPRPLVMRYRWSGLAPRHQCAMKGWSLLALLQFHVVRRGPQGLTLSLTTMREASLTMTSLGMMNSPRGFSGSSPEHSCDDDELLASPPRPPLTPLPVDSPKDNPGRIGFVCHREEAGPARALPDGKSRGPWTGHQGVATAPGDEDSRALPPVDQEDPQRVNQDHAQDMNPVLWNPSTFVDQDGTYFQVVGKNLPTQSVLVPQVPIVNQPAAAAGAPGQQASDPKFTMREFMDLMKFAQSQSVAAQRTPVTPVTGLTRQPDVPQKENLPPAVAVDNHPVESSTEVSASVSKHRSRTRTRSRKHRERRVERSRSPLVTSPSSRLSPSISGETIQYRIGCRDPLRLEVRDGGRRVSIPDRSSHQRKNLSHDSRRTSRSRSRSPLRTESSSRRTSRSARSRRERRHSQSSTSRQRVSDDDGSDIMVSPSRYSIFRNAVRTSRGAYTSVNPRGEGLAKASMVHLSQDDKPEKVAWSVQPQLRHAIDHVSMLAQGVKKIDKVAKTPLCEHTSRESSFKFLKPNEVFDRKENFRLKVDPDSDFPIKPPHLDGSLGSFSMPASFNVPAACVSASEELSRRAAVYGSIADVMFSSIIHPLAPEDERAPLLKERITIAAEASMRSIKASVAVASNLQLVRRDVVLDHLLLNQSTASRARTAPFSGTHLMGPDPNRFYKEIMKLREQQVLHGGLSANFRNPAALGTAQSRSVWNRDQSYNRPRGAGARGRQPFRRPSTAARQGQQHGQSRQQRGQPQQQQGRGGSNRRGCRSRSNRNESAPGGSASAARYWDVAGRGSLAWQILSSSGRIC